MRVEALTSLKVLTNEQFRAQLPLDHSGTRVKEGDQFWGKRGRNFTAGRDREALPVMTLKRGISRETGHWSVQGRQHMQIESWGKGHKSGQSK